MQKGLMSQLGANDSYISAPVSPMDERSRAGSMDSASLYRSSRQNRHAINSPAPESRHKDYNRYKYYGKLRTSLINHHITAGGSVVGSDALEL